MDIDPPRKEIGTKQIVERQPAISFSISFLSPFKRAGGRTSNVLQKMKTFFLAFLLGLIFPMVTNAELITAGTSIQDANAAMEAIGYSEGGLDVVAADPIRKLLGMSKKEEKDMENIKLWQVDQGFLIISYVVSTGKITTLSFHLLDLRLPKGQRMEFQLPVISFDPKTAKLVIQTNQKRKTGEQGADGKTPEAPQKPR